jgi:hypothetical protein
MSSKKSSHQFKKIRQEKFAKHQDVINKTRKLDRFLCKVCKNYQTLFF